MKYLLGIDVGTTGTKSALFDENGSLVDIEYKSYSIQYPEEGWVEQDADDWWNALVETVRAVVSRNACGSEVVSVCLATQGGALILLDENFHPVYNAVSWLDTRAKETSEKLTQRISVKELYETCGWPIVGGLNFPNVFWFREKRLELLKKTCYFASTIDYINYLLTGKFCIDYTNLAIEMFLDLNTRDYSDKILQIAGIARSSVPEIVPSGNVIGRLTNNAAKTLGLPGSVVVVSGAHDQYCANIGAGAVNVGDCVLSAGTAWVLLATCEKLYFNEDSLTGQGITSALFPGLHPLDGKYGLMTSVPFGGNSLKWFRDVLRPGTDYKQLNKDVFTVNSGSGGLLFIPIMSSHSGKGAFLGIDGIHTMKHFTRAVFEGVSFVNRRHFDMIQEAGVAMNNLIMIGGGAKSSVWPQIVADVCNVPVILPELRDSACAGAAILAGVGSGVFNSIEKASEKITGKKSLIKPVKQNVEIYKAQYEKFISCFGCV